MVDRFGPAGGHPRPGRDDEAIGSMIAGPPEAERAVEQPDLRRPNRRHRGRVVPLDEQVRKRVPVPPLMMTLDPVNRMHDPSAGVDVHEIEQVGLELGAHFVEPVGCDLPERLTTGQVDPDPSVDAVVRLLEVVLGGTFFRADVMP